MVNEVEMENMPWHSIENEVTSQLGTMLAEIYETRGPIG